MSPNQNAHGPEHSDGGHWQLPAEFVAWVHDALEHLFDLAFLHSHMQAACVRGQ